jgi:hypothetical protein
MGIDFIYGQSEKWLLVIWTTEQNLYHMDDTLIFCDMQVYSKWNSNCKKETITGNMYDNIR